MLCGDLPRDNICVIIFQIGAEMTDWIIINYRDPRGRMPVEEYLDALQIRDRARVLREIELLEEYGPFLRMPHARHLHGKLWELRIDTRPSSYRVLYAAVVERKFVLLHIFAKKSEKTPASEIEIAEHRLADYLARSAPNE